ncbi:hypothetical protein DYD21_07050 [Rhodohalobacter sp. SW132]|uniref:hypothetical protein n=1 Tax=Rhodohalobacter sp. SW132 TaxID=2293433 RepID=UPI000E254A20|nr:hypothetical protein [Rhodohalobacter sp. SW132]REL37542.1 hypothetical protein DYD21_07050 [Rhodohalobacter sp. SW132]
MQKKSIEDIVQKIFNSFGYRIHSLEYFKRNDIQFPIDVRKKGNDPKFLRYYCKSQPVIIDAPIEKGRGHPVFSFHPSASHPFVIAAKKALISTKSLEIIYNELKIYYENVQPKYAAELLGLNDNNNELFNYPAWTCVLPWDIESIEQWAKKNEESIIIENNRAGINIDASHGWAWTGPVSEFKLNIEAKRLHKLLKSVKKYGYKRNSNPDGDIKSTVLIDENDNWSWMATTGQHRLSVLSALGKKTIPIRVNKIVDIDDLDIWPNVTSGLYTKKEARQIFNRIFHGRLPACFNDWCQRSVNNF